MVRRENRGREEEGVETVLPTLWIRSGDGLRAKEEKEVDDSVDDGEDGWYREWGVGVGGGDGKSEKEAGEEHCSEPK